MNTNDYPQLHWEPIDYLRETLDQEGLPGAWADCKRIIDLENQDIITELSTGDTFKQTYRWQPFVNFWMDWMWREKKQANYVKLALVMQAIAQKDGPKVSQADDFETWCNLAKYHQNVYFKQFWSKNRDIS